eukprot:5030540-Amphidinium_carterae.1
MEYSFVGDCSVLEMGEKDLPMMDTNCSELPAPIVDLSLANNVIKLVSAGVGDVLAPTVGPSLVDHVNKFLSEGVDEVLVPKGGLSFDNSVNIDSTSSCLKP